MIIPWYFNDKCRYYYSCKSLCFWCRLIIDRCSKIVVLSFLAGGDKKADVGAGADPSFQFVSILPAYEICQKLLTHTN